MKILKYAALIGIAVFITSCATTAKFPVSTKVPAAEITARKKQDNNKNYVIELTAFNLAEASRLDPQMTNYCVWIVADNGSTINVGQIRNKNAKKAVLKAVTPFNAKEIFITAEKQGNLSYPAGIEISRTTFK